MKQILISELEAGQRLDKYLHKYFDQAPKSFVYKMLRKKRIKLNGSKASGSEHLKINDTLQMYLSEETINNLSIHDQQIKLTAIDFSVIYEDEQVLIVNKPVGLLSQKSHKDSSSLVEQITTYLLQTGAISSEQIKGFRPSICHRLDRNTSGLVIAGKTITALQTVTELIKYRKINKYYLTIVKGKVSSEKSIEGFLVKNEQSNKVQILNKPFKDALPIKTKYLPLKTNGTYTLLLVKLITGRTHQIRVHLASEGHPIIGDYKYGNPKDNIYFKKHFKLETQWLHAYKVEFPQMDGDLSYLSHKEFQAELPKIFLDVQNALFR